jgi:formylglycine-generating enzyme required for sulfatase activity
VTPRLNYAVADAQAVAAALPDLGFPRQNVRVLLDGEATRARIESVLYREFTKIGADDRLLVYFAGHGETLPVRGGEEGYFLPVDADRAALPATAILMEDMKRIGKRVRAKHVLFVMDACFSGFSLTRDLTPRSTTDAYLASAMKEPVVQVLTAGRKGERAIEEGGHGLFTRRFLDGLRGLADPDGRGIITAGQLGAWLEPRVTRDSDGRMHPQSGRLDGEGQFVFLRPGATLAALPPVPPGPLQGREEIRQEFGSLSVSARVAGVDVWIGDQKIWTSRPGASWLVPNLPMGTHRVVGRKDGHREWEREVRVAANQRQEVMIDIEPLGPQKVVKGDDGADMVLVPAGEFWMGSTRAEVDRATEECKKAGVAEGTCKDWTERELPRHRVTLDAFYIDSYEVTNALFERFVRAASHRTTAESEGWGRAWKEKDGKWQWIKVDGATWRAPNGPGTSAGSDHPVVQVSWLDASAYCQWAGKRLPTEAEWEKAARGTDSRRYPWGEDWDASKANGQMSVRATRPVGSYPGGVSPHDAHDMAGNVWEWVADWFDKDYYGSGSERNPTGPASGQSRVLRGGSWLEAPVYLRSVARHNGTPGNRSNSVGFRCGRGAF